MARSISWVLRPFTAMRPANGMLIIPSGATICSGKVTAFVVRDIDCISSAMAPNNMAGGASHTDTSRTSPGPIA